ncbi:helix-turn-helix domain-containing protein [Patescibacteria group bacterium]|nr:helix-turn-helix domain-containing protein [Patescibacteria group bacterium]
MVSKVRVKLLQTFLYQPDEIFYVRQLVRKVGEEINAVRRELSRMEKANIVKKEPRGNRLYYYFNRDHLLYEDLLSMVHKTVGLGKEIIKNKSKLGRVKLVMFSGRFARRLPTEEGGVDLLVVGDINMQTLVKLVRTEEAKLEREINYTVMTKDEFNFRKKKRDPFLQGILLGSRIMIIGDQEDLVAKYGGG